MKPGWRAGDSWGGEGTIVAGRLRRRLLRGARESNLSGIIRQDGFTSAPKGRLCGYHGLS